MIQETEFDKKINLLFEQKLGERANHIQSIISIEKIKNKLISLGFEFVDYCDANIIADLHVKFNGKSVFYKTINFSDVNQLAVELLNNSNRVHPDYVIIIDYLEIYNIKCNLFLELYANQTIVIDELKKLATVHHF